MNNPMPKDNEVDEKAVLWRAPHGSGKWMHFEHEPKHLKSYEPLYSAATVAELRAEVERLRAIEEAARIYYRKYCQDEAGDEPDDDGRGLWTGASAKQINDAAALRDALTGADPT